MDRKEFWEEQRLIAEERLRTAQESKCIAEESLNVANKSFKFAILSLITSGVVSVAAIVFFMIKFFT